MRRVEWLDEAKADWYRIESLDHDAVMQALDVLDAFQRGRLDGKPLADYRKTGDLSDCLRLYFGDEDEYRIVLVRVGETYEVYEVAVVAERSQDLPYLLAGVRLGRVTDPIRLSDMQRTIHRLTKQDP